MSQEHTHKRTCHFDPSFSHICTLSFLLPFCRRLPSIVHFPICLPPPHTAPGLWGTHHWYHDSKLSDKLLPSCMSLETAQSCRSRSCNPSHLSPDRCTEVHEGAALARVAVSCPHLTSHCPRSSLQSPAALQAVLQNESLSCHENFLVVGFDPLLRARVLLTVLDSTFSYLAMRSLPHSG